MAHAANGRYTEVKKSGHYVPFDAPESVVAAVIGVLDAARSSAAIST